MKNLQFNLKSGFFEKLKLLLVLVGVLIGSINTAYAATRRLYYDNSSTNWGTVYCYCWKDGGANDQKWPGKPMTRIGSTNIWYRDVTTDNCNRCIFNNSGSKTSDQTIPSDKNKCTWDGTNDPSWSTHQVTSSASLSATSTSIGIGATSTLTPSLSSNSDYNDIQTTSYSVTTNPGSAGSVTSAGVFSATASGTYTVTATVTYNAKGFSGITSTTTATKQITVYDYIYFYAAIPNGWDNRTTTVRLTSSSSSALTPYDNTSLASTTKNASSPCVQVYSAVSSTSYYNGGAKYNVYIYKVLESDAGKSVYLGHSSWTFGTAIGTVAAGKLYTLTSGDNGGTYMTANAISVNSVTASGPYAINAVTLTSSISAYGTSTANLRTAGGDTFTTTYTLNDVTASTSTVITPSVSNTYTSNTGNLAGSISIDASDLIAGHTYTLTVTIADDITGEMTSSATSSSFAVTASGHDITYTTQSTGWTYGTKPTVSDKDETVTFVVTPTDGYTVEVTSSDVTLSGPNEDNEYTFTMPDKDVEITVSASPNNYAITYSPASAPIGAVYTTTPANADYGSTVNLTIDRWAGYSTSVSVKDEDDGNVSVTNATSRTPSFTMPAKAVTVTVTATKINKPIVYVLKTNVAAGSNIENFSSVSSDADYVLFWGWGNGGSDNFYTSSASWDSNVQLSDARVGTYIDEHGNTWYEFISNRSTFNLSTEYMVILRLKNTRNLYESNADGHWVDGTECNSSTNTYFKGITWIVPNGKTNDHSAQLYTSNPDGVIRASIEDVSLSVTRVPPTAPITATPTMYVKGAVNKAYCWGVYTDAGCTEGNKVSGIAFTSLGDGKVQFMAPQTRGTYYLKLTVRSTDACGASIDDEDIEEFEVTTDDMVFFKNVPGWGNVHVYFLGTSDYWDDDLGSGCAGRDNGIAHGMSRIGNSDVYYYDYHGNSNVVFDGGGKAYIAFTDNYKPNSNNFSGCQAVYRADFSTCAPMLVPENYITEYKNTSAGDGQAAYYNRGYWTPYMSTASGFTLHVYDGVSGSPSEVFSQELTGSVGDNTYRYTYNFSESGKSAPYIYGFKVAGCGGSWYGTSSTMTVDNCTDFYLGTGTSNCGLTVNANLSHTFIMTLTGDGKIKMDVEYPLNEGDFRLLYDDNTQNPHPSQFIRKRANGKDTVAMFIRPSETENLKVQYCYSIVGETITWRDYEWDSDNETADINVAGKADGVYNFYLEQDGSGNLTVNTSETKPYTGLYYIRTSCVDGGWNSYKSTSDNLMTYAQYPEEKGYGFNYYKAKWVGTTGTDVTYTIACDYSPSLCDTLTADPDNNPLSASEAASLPHTANIRFGWHSGTNQLKRAYINGSTNVADRFLVMIGDTKLKDKDGNALAISGLNANEISFSDLNNWIYRCDITAVEGAAVKLTANYDSHIQYFIGTSGTTEEILGGKGSKEYLMRVTYDFKTNRLMTAWLPSGSEIDANVELKADMMLIREGQNAATQVYFKSSGISISNIHRIYGVMEFQYDHIAGKFPSWSSPNAYKYLMYYISFPFDVKVSEIFGAGVRGENWIIQKYNGAKRAQIGWFADTSTFWETMDGSETMNKHEGYLLLLDRITFNDPSSSIWYKQSSGNSVYLYFPSSSNSIGTIDDEDKVVTVPTHTCTINRDFTIDGVAGTLNHRNTDSHWNILGTPLFETHTASTIGDPVADGAGGTTLKYFYSWNFNNNTLRPQAVLSTDTTFKSMHSYMVQYAGNVTFHGAAIKPSVAARRIPSSKNYQIELQMVNGTGEASYTYVELRENAKDTFELNEDMYMVRSSDLVDLYTFAGAYDVAANVLSENNHVVQVGMDVKQADTYRFTMPNEFSGTVTLVDSQTGVRQNLALGDYTVYLERGTYNNRISLEINIEKTTTSLEGNDVKDGKAHKFMKDGILYILKNGITYDARGNRVD